MEAMILWFQPKTAQSVSRLLLEQPLPKAFVKRARLIELDFEPLCWSGAVWAQAALLILSWQEFWALVRVPTFLTRLMHTPTTCG